tara:strand:+ start:1514 stop:1933 length:420 start_codon:yes stop_codon:yes gene_type:complete
MKDKFFLSKKIKVQEDNDGKLSVFCTEDIKEGEIIEKAPIILLHDNKWEKLDPQLFTHAYPWPELREDWKDFCDEHGGILYIHATRPAIVLGYGMAYKRGEDSNVRFRVEKKLFACHFTAKRVIKEGEELFIYKNKDER